MYFSYFHILLLIFIGTKISFWILADEMVTNKNPVLQIPICNLWMWISQLGVKRCGKTVKYNENNIKKNMPW